LCPSGAHRQELIVLPQLRTRLEVQAARAVVLRNSELSVEKQNVGGVPHDKALNDELVASIFDEMAEDYDDISDLWYAWLFDRLHYFLLLDLARSRLIPGAHCLDVGCGTGFQTVLLSLCGHKVIGTDISTALLNKARRKRVEDYLTKDLFRSPFVFHRRYSEIIRQMASQYRNSFPLGNLDFRISNATQIPFPDESFEIVTCCGSTLSFIDDYQQAIFEIVRVLKPGGMLFMEVENKFNLDMMWSIIDGAFLHHRLGFKTKGKQRWFSKWDHTVIEYPLSTPHGDLQIPLRLFASSGILKDLAALGVCVNHLRSIHAVTSFIPSVFLDQARPNRKLLVAFKALALIEQAVALWPGIRRWGCSLVITGRKKYS
jgi:ubiquinone/menaquinone biosynthesis C-methylase UbiE